MYKNLCKVKKRIKETVASNRNDLYKSHLYWSQKPYNICDILIEELSEKDSTILDPFMGSGVTVMQSISNKFRRKAIGVEINDVPIFIVETLLEKYDLKECFEEIENFIKYANELNTFYETKCIKCGNTGTITKVIFDRENFRAVPRIKEIYYKCNCDKKVIKKHSSADDFNKMNYEYSNVNVENQTLINNSRIAVCENQKIKSIFTSRNFKVIDQLIGYIDVVDYEKQDLLKYVVLSILHLAKITDTHSNSQWPLWTPKKNCVEKNIPELIRKRSKALIKSLKYIEKNISLTREKSNSYDNLSIGDYLIIKKGIQNLEEEDLPDKCVDLVITDPPYLGQILYSEYMQLYKPFLKLNFNLKDEIVVSNAPDRNKKEDEYYKLLDEGLKNISRVMKDYSYMCMYFHDSNLSVWNKLITIMTKHNLRYLSQVHVKKNNTLKNIISPKKSLNGDAILFFIKEPIIKFPVVKRESIEEIEINIVKHARYIIKMNDAMSTPELYDDGLMEFLIQNGWLEKISKQYKSLVEIFEKHLIWDSEIGKWRI